jgi:hypothetical protein
MGATPYTVSAVRCSAVSCPCVVLHADGSVAVMTHSHHPLSLRSCWRRCDPPVSWSTSTHSLILFLTLTHSPTHSLTRSLTRSLTHSPPPPLSCPLPPSQLLEAVRSSSQLEFIEPPDMQAARKANEGGGGMDVYALPPHLVLMTKLRGNGSDAAAWGAQQGNERSSQGRNIGRGQ